MEPEQILLLPGTRKQSQILINTVKDDINKILIIGAGSTAPSLILRDNYNAEVIIIVEDEDSLLNDRLRIRGQSNISVRMMDFAGTDFHKEQYDLIYAQASISNKRRSKIVKEVKRILKPGGILCAGEMTSITDDPPQFVKDIWETSAIAPIKEKELVPFYTNQGFEIILEQDLQSTLTEYYSLQSDSLPQISGELSPNEKSYYKKLLNRMSHESNVYLKLGGHRHMGYRMLILRKAVL